MYINWSKISNKESKFAEVKHNGINYYGIGSKGKVIDYFGKTRSEAKAFIETELALYGQELGFLGAYQS
ncbi:hypothetical protein EEL31_08640 [Brevibacillus laterosporus]|uniref:Uncharacterized protein n=1 Tax=Brevibacillus laterosporus TaxID=1465 RepID=A0A518VCA3_BRELA|nr:hypothetical protein [Brevibacillus laterosporus]QDX94615.1 hypothetical protein EEL30_21460 [Brevibacillus laterosporus]TPG68578.1 hypothetical protein EEL31_08640 [Brevibacillus laterosporus]